MKTFLIVATMLWATTADNVPMFRSARVTDATQTAAFCLQAE